MKLLMLRATKRISPLSPYIQRYYTSGVLYDRYHALVNERDVEPDPHQLVALEALEDLRDDLAKSPPATEKTALSSTKSSSSFFGFMSKSAPKILSSSTMKQPKGVYLHGGVGCGKTFLMNLFYDSIDENHPWSQEKHKVHFHSFMLKIHQEMHIARKHHNNEPDAILPEVIDVTLKKGKLLCFDEFQVTDVADALILQRLFTGLWEKGCVVLATSNRDPDMLYWNGLQRDRFLPFIDLLKKQCHVVSMSDSQTDYRIVQKKSGTGKIYFTGKEGRKDFNQLFYELVGTSAVAPTALQTQGRKVFVPQAALKKGICRFTFEELCQKALGAADYLVIGKHFHTVFVEAVPNMGLIEINWMRRFITFVDSMYENKVKLIIHARAPANQLVPTSSVNGSKIDHDELFAFDRTVSRLEEMASQKYLQTKWSGLDTVSKAELLSNRKAVFDLYPSLSDERRTIKR